MSDSPVKFSNGSSVPSSSPLGGLMGADAQHSLAQAFERALIQMNQDALKELAFIELYCPGLMPEIKEIINYRFHTSPGILGKIINAIKAVALHDYHKEANKQSMLGGK